MFWRKSVLLITFLSSLLLLFLAESRTHAAPANVNLNLVWNRVRNMERKLDNTQSRLKKAMGAVEKQLTILNERMKDFEDYPPCPQFPDFYLNRRFKSCYHLEPSNVLVNWTEAENICQNYSQRAHLVSIENSREQNFLKTKWQNARGISSFSRFWTSGSQVGDSWKWNATRKPITYKNWIPVGQSMDQRFQCLAISSTDAYYWGGVACWAPHMVTCEINL